MIWVQAARLTNSDSTSSRRVQYRPDELLCVFTPQRVGSERRPAGERGEFLECIVVDVEACTVHFHLEEGDGAHAYAYQCEIGC